MTNPSTKFVSPMSCFYVTQKGASLHAACVSVYLVCVQDRTIP